MTTERTERFSRLVTLLKELFQLDKPDLDFGFYRIMHAKEAEVTRFLEVDLLPQVKHEFQQYRSADRATLEQQLAEAERGARELGVDPDAVPKVKELRKAIDAGTDVDALEADVYDHLYRFFRRYYSEGDFISQRVYKDGVYAIPYQGEEIKLHWANADQYYIKTTEYLKDYSFRLRPESESDPMRVHFRLADAAEGEHGNIKAADEKARRFVLLAEDFVGEEEGPDGVRELVIRFEYRTATLEDWPGQKRQGKKRPPKQRDLNEAAATTVLDTNDLSLARWMQQLAATHVKADGIEADHSRLRSHLDRYTARNTYDYFIHKDLGGFLRRELDFYVKNEVIHLDDIDHETEPRVEEWLSKIKVIRAIAHKIIDFLAQLEGFQKKLCLKKKFVVETSYCVAVGSIPEAFYAEIVANRVQHDEWVDLHGIDELAGDLARAGYSDPLTTEFLRAHPTLVVDTQHYGADFTERLLEALGAARSLNEITDGVLFHSENLQALRLMEQRYRGRVDCVYIDPPYNTGGDDFVFKDTYQHSSWMTMMRDRLAMARRFLVPHGVMFVSIDRNELANLQAMMASVFANSAEGLISWRRRHNQPNDRTKMIGLVAEYLLAHAKDPRSLRAAGVGKVGLTSGFGNPDDDPRGEWASKPWKVGTGQSGTRYTIVTPTGRRLDEEWMGTEATYRDLCLDGRIIFPRGGNGMPRKKYYRHERVAEGQCATNWWHHEQFGHNAAASARLDSLFGEPKWFDNPKPAKLIGGVVQVAGREVRSVMDYFAGSGTTAEAVIGLNRDDAGARRFTLVEMAHYFDTVLLPRVKKVTFSPEWENGRPSRLAEPEEARRSPRIVKVVRLESYEDTLNNLVVHRPQEVQRLLDENSDGGPNAACEDYIIRYMLDVETGNSPSLLDLSAFLDPSAYRLKVQRPGSDESREVTVDLVETFNWLLGLRVSCMSAPKRYDAEFSGAGQNNSTATVALRKTPEGRWWFRAVKGVLPDDRRAVVIWRNRPGGDDPDGVERDNAVLDEWFKQSGHHARQGDFDLIYANGDHNLEGLKETERTWTGHTIEDHFKRLMFEGTEGVGDRGDL